MHQQTTQDNNFRLEVSKWHWVENHRKLSSQRPCTIMITFEEARALLPNSKTAPSIKLKLCGEERSILYEKFNFDYDQIKVCMVWYDIARTRINMSPSLKKYIFIITVYHYCVHLRRGYDLSRISRMFCVEPTKIYPFVDDVLHTWKTFPWYKDLITQGNFIADGIKRKVYEMSMIPKHQERKVITAACKVLSSVKNHPSLITRRTHSLQASCIYIACKVHKVQINKIKFCEQMTLSMPTLDAIEFTIQNILANS